jgi:hypothetical protein
MQMKQALIYIVLLFLAVPLYGQKTKPKVAKSRFVCVADSLDYYAVKGLVESQVDSIMTFLYDYDNGRVEEAVHYIIWLHEGKGKIRAISGCNQIGKANTADFDSGRLFNFYAQQHAQLEKPMKNSSWQSHDMGYYIKVYLPGQTNEFNIRDNQRFEEDPKVAWVRLFEELKK